MTSNAKRDTRFETGKFERIKAQEHREQAYGITYDG